MKHIANEKLDIIVNLSKLIGVEVRDERGMTKLVIPIAQSGLNLTEQGNVHLRLKAHPIKDNAYGSTHILKLSNPEKRYINKKGKDIIGSVYLSGKHEYDASKAETIKKTRDAKIKEFKKANKYKGLEF